MSETLLQVHVLFRHGDKTPDKVSVYPKDPYKDEEYYPYGHGQLTNEGKLTAYKLGQVLRTKYEKFLGETYKPGLLDAWSSELDRTKMTIQLVLASLFPPKGKQIWEKNLPWQPIPYHTSSKLFLLVLFNPTSVKAYDDYLEVHGKEIFKSRLEVFRHMEEHAGLTIKTVRQSTVLINALVSQRAMGMKLPSWTEMLWPDAIPDLINCEFDILTSTTQLKYFTTGLLLEKIVNDTRLKIDGTHDYKIHLYSGHDLNLATMLRCLGVNSRLLPSYGANLIFELHKIEDVFGYKIYYQHSLAEEAELLQLGDWGTFCPLDKFLGLIQDILDQKGLYPDFD